MTGSPSKMSLYFSACLLAVISLRIPWDTVSQELEIVSNIQPKNDGLNVRTRGSQPSICVPTFSQFTNAGTGRLKYTYSGHIGPNGGSSVNAVAWSPDNTRIASGSDDYTVQVWDATTGGHAFPYTGHTDRVQAVAWSPDGTRIASGSADKTVQVWIPSRSAGETLHYSGHTDSVEAIAWSSDGQHLASGSVDKTVRVWDLSSSGNPYVFQNHTNEVYTVARSPGGFPWPWSHEGQRLASGGKDTTVRLWQAV
jgi:WD40 repeat protein